MGNHISVKSIREGIDKFRWGKFEREYENDRNKLAGLYWNCVVSDIIDSRLKTDDDFQAFTVRLHKSYLGCFYRVHELHQGLLVKFEGLHQYYRYEEPYSKVWTDWLEELDLIQAINLKVIINAVTQNHHDEVLIKVNNKKLFQISAFDNYHIRLAQLPSHFLLEHLNQSRFKVSSKPLLQVTLPYRLNENFESNLQAHAINFIKARVMKYTLNLVDRKFQNGVSIIEAFPRLSPSEAIKDLLILFPEYNSLSNTEISYLAQQRYKNLQGEELKINSLYTAITRLRS